MREQQIFIELACIVLGMGTGCGSEVPVEAEMNSALSAKYGSNYHVLSDRDMNWGENYLSMIADQRAKDKNYPYMVVADLDGDDIPDLAAEVMENGKDRHQLAVLWGRSKIVAVYDVQLCDAISLMGPKTYESGYEDHSLNLNHDALLVVCFEKSAWIMYWDGNQFNRYFTSD
jgi:hypothetical protein